jgi:ParB family chromosome partitioning protein
MEEARAYHSLMELAGSTQEQVAEAVGKNRSTVANALRLLRLPEDMQEAVRDGSISAGHARSLLALTDTAARETLFRRIVAEGLSVRQAELAVQELTVAHPGRKSAKSKARDKAADRGDDLDPDLKALQELYNERFGTKVQIRGDMTGGSIEIEYYSADDLQRILDTVSASA